MNGGLEYMYVLHVPATAVSLATATPGVGLVLWEERYKKMNLRKSLECFRK